MKIPMFPPEVAVPTPAFGLGFKEILNIAFWLDVKDGFPSKKGPVM
jgi:hypothetical protein